MSQYCRIILCDLKLLSQLLIVFQYKYCNATQFRLCYRRVTATSNHFYDTFNNNHINTPTIIGNTLFLRLFV